VSAVSRKEDCSGSDDNVVVAMILFMPRDRTAGVVVISTAVAAAAHDG